MRIHFLLFASYRDMSGVSEVELELRDGSDAGAALAELRAHSGRLARLPERPVIAINREYATLDAVLSDGDEVALLPPVAGG